MAETLCVDLDGTLVKTDTLIESVLRLVRTKPHFALRVLFWLLRGKAAFKQEVARHATLDASTLPYNYKLIELLERQSARGARLVLATAAHSSIAKAVARHTRLFERIYATDGTTNLSGKAKLEAILRDTPDFVYAGNSNADIEIWKKARAAIVVGSQSMCNKASKVTELREWIAADSLSPRAVLRALRVHQWAKNLLIFLPMILAHQWQSAEKLILGFWIFSTFSLIASGVYLFNDLLDLEVDRAHPHKCKRPLASGEMSLASGALMALFLFFVGFGVAALVSFKLVIALLGYLILTSFYSSLLKKIVLVDGFTLAGLYSWRVLAGGLLTAVPITFWLVAFCVFFFLSLAFVKRVTELSSLKSEDRSETYGRGYRVGDLETVRLLGVSSGIGSVVILALYMNYPGVTALYATPSCLLGAAMALLYWICRVWVKTERGEMHSDPVVFAIKDRVSYAVLAAVAFFAVLAKWIHV